VETLLRRRTHKLAALLLALSLLVPGLDAWSAEASRDLRLHLVASQADAFSGEATELWLWRDAAWEVLPLVASPERQGSVVAQEGCVSGATALVVGETRVSAPWTLTDDFCRRNQSVEVLLMPRATVGGRVTVAEGESLPQTAEIRVDRCADSSQGRGALTSVSEASFFCGTTQVCSPPSCSGLPHRSVRGKRSLRFRVSHRGAGVW